MRRPQDIVSQAVAFYSGLLVRTCSTRSAEQYIYTCQQDQQQNGPDMV